MRREVGGLGQETLQVLPAPRVREVHEPVSEGLAPIEGEVHDPVHEVQAHNHEPHKEDHDYTQVNEGHEVGGGKG